MKGFGQALSLGFSIASCLIGGYLIGSWLDQMAQTHPLFLIVGILSGVVAAFLMLYKMTQEK